MRFNFKIADAEWRYIGRNGPIKFKDETGRIVSRDGCCDLPDAKRPAIRINEAVDDPRWYLYLVVHEYLHAALPWLDESTVRVTAEVLTEILFDRMGYRKDNAE